MLRKSVICFISPLSFVFDIDALLSLHAVLEKTVGLYEKVDIFTERISWLEIQDFSVRELFFGDK